VYIRHDCADESKAKEEYLYSAFLHQGTHKALRHGSHSLTCKQHHACLSFMSVHQMSPPQQLRQQSSSCSLLLIYRPRKDQKLSWPGWLTYSGWLTHISGHPSATGRAQDSESTPAKDRRYTAVLRNQPWCVADVSRSCVCVCVCVCVRVSVCLCLNAGDDNFSVARSSLP